MGVHNYEKVEEDGEQSPFLDDTFDSSNPISPALDTAEEKAAHKFRMRVTMLMFLIIIAVDLPSVMHHASQIKIFESIICHQYYLEHDPTKFTKDGTIPEEMCKIEPVQAEMSSLKGWGSFWGHLPGNSFRKNYDQTAHLSQVFSLQYHSECLQINMGENGFL